jgi:hypothetical protein
MCSIKYKEKFLFCQYKFSILAKAKPKVGEGVG